MGAGIAQCRGTKQQWGDPMRKVVVCAICESLPKLYTCGHHRDDSITKAGQKLTPPLPDGNKNGTSKHICPNCGAEYSYSRGSEWDDMDEFVDQTLIRLKVIDQYGAEEVKAQKTIWELFWREQLNSGSEKTIVEAASNWASLLFYEKNWDELVQLLNHPLPTVQYQTVNVLCVDNTLPNSVSAPLVAKLSELANSPNQGVAKAAKSGLDTLDFIRNGVTNLGSPNAATREQAASVLRKNCYRLLNDQLTALVPLLSSDDNTVASAIQFALSYRAENDTLDQSTALALGKYFEDGPVRLVLIVTDILYSLKKRLPSELINLLAPWVQNDVTTPKVIELLYKQSLESADLTNMITALTSQIFRPAGRRACTVLGSIYRNSDNRVVFETLMNATLNGSWYAGEALLSSSRRYLDTVSYDAQLRDALNRAQNQPHWKNVLVKILVRNALTKPNGLNEWLYHQDISIVGLACTQASYLDPEPWFDRLIALAPQSFGSIMWLTTWGMRNKTNAQRLLALLPEAPQIAARARWQELKRRAK